MRQHDEKAGCLKPVRLFAAYHAALARFDNAALEDMFAPDAVYISDEIGNVMGSGAILEAFRVYFAMYRYLDASQIAVEPLGALAARATWRLTLADRNGGRRFSRIGIETVRFDHNEKIISIEVETFDGMH